MLNNLNTKRAYINSQIVQGKSYINILKLCDKYFFQKRITELLDEKEGSITFYKSKVPRIITTPKHKHKYKLYLPTFQSMKWFEYLSTILLVFLHEPKNIYDAEAIAKELYINLFLRNPPTLKPPIAYQNWSESCYLDSLLVCIFFGGNMFHNINLFKNNTNEAIKLKAALNHDYTLMIDKHRYTTLTCHTIRDILRSIIPHPLGNFGVSETFDALADIFLCMKTTNIPYINLQNNISSAYIRNSFGMKFSAPFVSMWEFMDGDTIRSRLGRVILWDKFESPFITFQNTLAPHIKRFSDTESEILLTNGEKNKHRKSQCFSEYILNKRYKLVYVISHKSPKNSLETGHYVVFIRPKFDDSHWYEYDDLRCGWIKLATLPDEVFLDNGWMRPELLYYEFNNEHNYNKMVVNHAYYRDVFVGNRVTLLVNYNSWSINKYKSDISIILRSTSLPNLSFCEHKPKIFVGKNGKSYKWDVMSHEIAHEIVQNIKEYDSIPS